MEDRRLLALIGEALYGDHWKKSVAIKLGIADRSVRRWIQTNDLPDWVWGELDSALRERAKELREAEDLLREKISETD